MTLFQAFGLALFVVLSLATLSAGVRGTARKRIVVFWLSVWLSGSVAIIWPHSTALVAHALGIGRGADLLLYLSVLGMFVAFFYVYTRFRRLDRQITLLVRELAIEKALSVPRGPQLPAAAPREPSAEPRA